MSLFWLVLYNIVLIPLFWVGVMLASLFNRKIKEGIQCRRGWFRSLRNEMKRLDQNRKRVLFHCSSVGEWIQAVPIIEGIKNANPNIEIIVSFLSPSGYNFFKHHPDLAFKTYLPFDTRRNAMRFLGTIRPDIWVISKYDVWPNHMEAAKRLEIPVILISALLSEKSGRDKGISGIFNRYIYQSFCCIFPVSEHDRKRFLKIYPFPNRLFVAGSTAFDSAYNRSLIVRAEERIPIFKSRDEREVVFLGGSIWPSDAVHLIPALIVVLNRFTHLKAILVPHELHEQHIRDIETALIDAGMKSRRYTEFSKTRGTQERIAIIDTIGVLARLYRQSDIAYVGGSCGPGVHNVTEPAVFGQPVLFGPRYRNSFEAIELVNAGCGFMVDGKEELEGKLNQLIKDDALRTNIGEKALHLIKANVGATDRILSVVRNRFEFVQ